MIKHIRVTNFKSLAYVDVSLEPVTVLIGRSGMGKSNFVESLRFLHDYLIQRDDRVVDQHYGGWERLLSAGSPRPQMVSFDVRFTAPEIEEEYRYQLSFKQHPDKLREKPTFHEEKLSLGDRVLYHQQHQEHWKWHHKPEGINLPPPGNLMLGGITGNPETTNAYLVLTNGLGCYHFPDDVLAQSAQNSRPDAASLSDRGENYLQTYTNITINLKTWWHSQEILAAIQILDPSIKAVEVQLPERNRITVVHEVNGRHLQLDLDQKAEGFRRFLAYLIALYQTPPKQTLVFEEPEKGIHPAALAALADQFKACPEAGRGQVILTTHSPDLLDHFEPEQLRVVEIEDYHTRIGPVASEQLEALREQLLKPGELLTVDLARLETAAN